jgi:anaerobic ribonucleoside-triphosphate reductase
MEKQTEKCHDCGTKMEIINKEIIGGKILKYKDGSGQEYLVAKCDECFKKNPGLTNFQPCEVYSRVVGYIRPVQQWNDSKREEFRQRKTFKLSKNNIELTKAV